MKRDTPDSRYTFSILHSPFSILLLLLTILLLAAFLRFYRLDAQSFWNDEGNSARLSERTLDLIIEGTASDIHPPAYYILLHYWRAIFGQSEFALRSLSVVAGLALAAFTYRLGCALFGESTGVLAAFLGAISPFAIYYSQEARMYALLAALSVASTFFAIRLSRFTPPVSRLTLYALRFTLYILTSAAGLYTHYAFAFVLLAHNAVFGLRWLVEAWHVKPRWRRLALWAGMQAAVIALYGPWLPIALGARGWSSPGASYDLGRALLDVLRVLTVGITQPLEEATAVLIGAGALLIVGLWPGPKNDEHLQEIKQPNWLGVVSILLYLLIPIALFFALNLYKPAWLKFLVIALAPFHILVAHGMSNLAKFMQHTTRISSSVVRSLLLLAFAVVTLPSLQNLYFDPAYARDDYRQIAADIRAMQPSDAAIVLNAPNQWEVFTYYYPDREIYAAPYHPSAGKAKRFLTPILEEHERLFVLYWGDAESDPQKRIETRLATHAYKAADRWYGDVRLAVYGLAALPEEPDALLDARFGDVIRLRGHAVQDVDVHPGDIVPVTLFWEALGGIDEPYKVSVQVLDSEGCLLAQVDTVPRDGLAPTTIWEQGQRLVDRYGVLIPDSAPPGRYTLAVALYHPFTGERLPVSIGGDPAGDYLTLGDLTVGPRER